MLEESYAALHNLEETHWWYVGARAVYQVLITLGLPQGTDRKLLEVGSGSGGNISLLEKYGPVAALEISTDAIEMMPQQPSIGVVCASADALPFASNAFDGVVMFGVIEHLDDDVGALKEAKRVAKSGGMTAFLTSALPVLWSHHDEANLHKRRYYRKDLIARLRKAGHEPIRVSYQNFFTFLPVLLVRLWQRGREAGARYDMGAPSPIVNAILTRVLRFEAWMIRYFPLPIGVDLVGVTRIQKDGRE